LGDAVIVPEPPVLFPRFIVTEIVVTAPDVGVMVMLPLWLAEKPDALAKTVSVLGALLDTLKVCPLTESQVLRGDQVMVYAIGVALVVESVTC